MMLDKKIILEVKTPQSTTCSPQTFNIFCCLKHFQNKLVIRGYIPPCQAFFTGQIFLCRRQIGWIYLNLFMYVYM